MRGFADELAGGRLDARPGPLHPLAPAEVAELRAATVRTLDAFSAARGEVDALLVELRAANARLRPLAAAWAEMSDVVEVLDPAGVVRFVNPAWRARAPAGAPDPVGRPSALLSAAAVGGEALAGALLSGRPWHGELPGDDGAPVELLAATPVRGPEGALDVVVIVRRDLRPLRAAQAAATEADRLAAVGALAAGVAHEINNPLTYIRTNLELLTTAAEDPDLMPAEELAALARDATAGVDRVARTVRDLLAVARGGRGAAQEPAQVLELAELARSAAGLGAPQAGPRARVDVEVPAGLRSEVREGEIVRVLLNLVLNAAQAAGAGGRRGRVALQGGEDGAWVWIDVIDDGPGVPKEIAARIFEPFFTTRAEGQGSGLGLSVSRGIAQDHGGRLELRPGPGGACFRLSLPRAGGAGPPAGVRPPPRPARPIAPGAPPEARVLVVDDDPPVARSIARALRRFGVEVAHSGAEALARLEAHRFELVVSDVRMPGMSGPELHRRAQSVRRLPFLFVTGGAGEADSRALEATGCEVLPKPLDPRLLVARVEALLDAGG
jgi:signal transduction histidine kinase/CheY-like chemotaxis protein